MSETALLAALVFLIFSIVCGMLEHLHARPCYVCIDMHSRADHTYALTYRQLKPYVYVGAGAVIQWVVSLMRAYKPPVSILWFVFGMVICIVSMRSLHFTSLTFMKTHITSCVHTLILTGSMPTLHVCEQYL